MGADRWTPPRCRACGSCCGQQTGPQPETSCESSRRMPGAQCGRCHPHFKRSGVCSCLADPSWGWFKNVRLGSQVVWLGGCFGDSVLCFLGLAWLIWLVWAPQLEPRAVGASSGRCRPSFTCKMTPSAVSVPAGRGLPCFARVYKSEPLFRGGLPCLAQRKAATIFRFKTINVG